MHISARSPSLPTARASSASRGSSIASPSSVIRFEQNSKISGKPVASREPIDMRSFISVVSDDVPAVADCARDAGCRESRRR